MIKKRKTTILFTYFFFKFVSKKKGFKNCPLIIYDVFEPSKLFCAENILKPY